MGCADYVSKAWCTPDGDYGSGWVFNDEWGTFDTWAVNGIAANVACCGCGGGSTVTGKQACQGHSYDKSTCEAIGCCRYNVLFGCRAIDGDAQGYSGDPCDTTVAPGPSPGPGPKPGPGPGKKAMVGGLIAGATALAVAGGIMAKSTTPGPVTTASATTQGAQSTAVTTTTENSSSSLLWLWILLGILALCCLLALCGGGLAACMGGKKKKKKSKRATRVSEPAPVPAALPVVEEQQELLPMVPPLLEPYPIMPVAAPTMVETAVPMMQPTMVESAFPMMQTAGPTAVSAMPAMQIGAPAISAMPMMGNAMAPQAFPSTAMQGISGFGTRAW